MDRPEPGLVKWCTNSSVDSFIHINLQHRVVQVYEPTGHARAGRFDYKKVNRHDDFPPLTTYDWSPTDPGLLAVGTGTGIVNLLKIDDGSNAYVELNLKMSRTCQAVAFNTTGLLAVGLDRVRMDQCLHVWDVNRLSSDKMSRGFPVDANISEPKFRLEPSVSVSSVKFFEDSPQTLVVGIKAQGLRIHDLRDPSKTPINFQTKCNNNLTVDNDPNYFASSALDHPGIMIWDRRATSKPVASHIYKQAVEEDGVPWGGALRLDRVIDTDPDNFGPDGKHSLIRSIRYSRDHRGLLAVLSRTGQLKVLQTNKESPTAVAQDGPELLQVQKSHEMDVSYVETSRKNDRIVAFDWVPLGSTVLRPRLLVLRANGNFEILEQPSNTADHVYKLVPWQAPHRGLEEGAPYHSIMEFEPSQSTEMLGPLLIEQSLSEVPLFGPESAKIRADVETGLKSNTLSSVTIDDVAATETPLPDEFRSAPAVAAKVRALRAFVRDEFMPSANRVKPRVGDTKMEKSETTDLTLASDSLGSCREIHDALLASLAEVEHLPREAQCVLDHTMLLRAKEKYLFDAVLNRDIVADDPWVKYAWDWIATAEETAQDGGLMLGIMDLSYLGVHSVWNNDLGRNPSLRLSAGATTPDRASWERSIGSFCKKRHIPKFSGAETRYPNHRQLCLEICGWGDSEKHDPKGRNREPDPEYPTTIHTMAAARALFQGDTKQAMQILKKASTAHPELLFVSLALQLMGRGDKRSASEQLDFDEAVASKTDPYLRAISSLIATGDWAAIANQHSLPLSDRAYVAVRNLDDTQLTLWLREQVALAVAEGDIEGIVLTGIGETMVDIFARYIDKFHDVQTATLVLSICSPRYIDDLRCRAWRNAYRALLQRHKLFFHRTKFDVESTKRSKRDGQPSLVPPSRQIALRCVYCDADTSLANNTTTTTTTAATANATSNDNSSGSNSRNNHHPPIPLPPLPQPAPSTTPALASNALLAAGINAGVSCPNCGRHLPRCVVCLEVVGVPRSDWPEEKDDDKTRGGVAGRFPTFCLRCEHVLHLDHARQWFARHVECPVPECRCRCNFRANPELSYH